MIIIDTKLNELEAKNTPIRVGIIGAGFMAKGTVNQIVRYTKGMRLVGIANRTTKKAVDLYALAGIGNVPIVENKTSFDQRAQNGLPSVVEDPMILAHSDHIDVIVDLTGSIEHSTVLMLEAFKYGKHVVHMNAELDGTIGPILKKYADRQGVIYANAAGDQPGVELNLYRFVKGMGLTPVVCGNIKGLQDPYRTPTTQKAFAAKWGQNPYMVTSFADGTKISFEQAVVANATGMRVAKRGMHGYDMPGLPIEKTSELFDYDEIMRFGGIVDYVVGAQPNGGIFVLATMEDPIQKHYLDLYKVGKGPLYCFYEPYHLCHFELPTTIARAAAFNDANVTPIGGPVVEVLATAKTDLKKGEILDGIGGYKTYGVCENHGLARHEGLLPMAFAEGSTLVRDIPKDTVLLFSDVVLPNDRVSINLWHEQEKIFG